MHNRSQYKDRIDFVDLAESYPSLKPFLKSYVIDFRNADAQRSLTQALLSRDFGLSLCLPHDRLCPPVPNRLNYVLWIQDIMSSSTAKEIRGLDIGTGASVIYPLLACSLPDNSNWSFVATEIDPHSARYASMNIENNNLTSRITLHTIPPDSEFILAPLFTNPKLSFDFTMCNPPFYGSTDEIESSAENKEYPPNAVCTGAENEMITPGGETAFVLKILKESCHQNIKYRCRWFTSMLGKLSSVETVVSELRNLKIDNYALAQFIQGTTRRWCVAWSFGDERLADKYSRPTAPSLLPFLPLPTTLQQRLTTTTPSSAQTLLTQILSSIEKLSFTFTEKADDEWSCTISASENTWSRAARRSRKRAQHDEGSERQPSESTVEPGASISSIVVPDSDRDHPHLILVCRISAESSFCRSNKDTIAESSVLLTAQWLRGVDRSVFEGFWSHVCRKLKGSLSPLN